MRRLVIVSAALFACTQGAQEPSRGSIDRARPSSPVALYTNGGFESGNLSNWTITTNLNQGITYPPASLADLNLRTGGTASTFARSGATPESQTPAGMSATAALKYPKYGTWSAAINELGANQNVNSITQQMATTAADVNPADNLIHVRFVVAPVLQNPGHTNTQQPYYYVLVTNVTQGTTLFARFNYSNENGAPWQSDSSGTILYTGWQVVDVPGTAGSIAIGDVVQVRVIAAGCSLGGHWGEAYVDAFGAFLPGLSIAAHAPQKANAGSNLTTSYMVTNSGAGAANNVTVVAPVPPQTTFLSLSTPPGAVCTTPPVGGTGNVNCNFGTMNASSTLTFTLVTAISVAASGSIPNGSYTVASTGVSALLGPLVTTAVTSAISYADLSVTMDDGKGGVAWGQALQYTITVSNAGPVTATNATVVNPLPAQLTGATWTCTGSSGGTCGAASGNGGINSTVTLPAGGKATYVLSANVVSGSGTSRVTNVVNVATAGAVSDPDTTSNRAADTDDIGTVVTVTVQKDATGTGLGTVVSSPVAINCGPACTSASALFATGNLVTLTAVAQPGDTFASWSGACSGTSTTCNLNPATSVTATAKFVPQSFNVTASAPGGNGNLSCTSPVPHNQSSTCTIAPSSGYTLSNLTDNGADVTALVTSNSYTISSVAADHAVVATFLKDFGTACGGAAECAAGICVDGVCCNAACSGQCQACDVPGSSGACTTVTSGAPHGSRTACTSDGSACGGTCDGSSATACGYPGGSTACRAASCASGTAIPPASCNGSGTCPSASTTQCDPYVCGPTSCLTSCATDADCIAGDYCSAGACVPKKGNGLACGGANQCTSGSCADGVCCNQACSGQCQACDAPGFAGQCVAVAGTPHGPRPACASDGTACGGSCDGLNPASCAYPTAQCRGASCSAGVATAAASCNGSGACPAPSTTSCSPYVCGATACKNSCSSDSDCISGDYCGAGGACVPKKADGLACAAANQCGSGSCTDGVCCNQACNGQCQACDVPGSVGQCLAVTGAPHPGRAACAGSGSCAGACDGSNVAACTYPTSQCRAPSCASGVAIDAASCDGTGSCPGQVTSSCAPYVCGATACKTTCTADADCVSGDYCDAGGACVPKKTDGLACGGANQCTSGSCADGVCCNQACSGQCQACDVPGSVGQCVPVAGAPHAGRAACAGSGVCAGACDGSNAAACAYPTAQCRGASCAGGVATAAASCDGAGSCPALVTAACSPYVCGAAACRTSCSLDADCIASDYCNSSGACVPKKADGAACLAAAECVNGSCADGVCCDRACNGQCEACDAPGSVGQCVAVSGTPHGARPACAGTGICGGACDGVDAAACAYPDPTTSCRNASCAGGVATAAASCDGAGACPGPVTANCDPYVCGPTACKTGCAADADCVAQDYCDGSGQCVPRVAAGQACTAANQCGTGFCVDGFCCDQACAGQCQACDVAGSEGACSPVAGDPHGSRTACLGSGTACGGACDGVITAACAYPGASLSCRGASCSGGTAILAAGCDGAGSCPAQQTQSCAPYVCGATACLGNCSQDADCTSGDWCSGGVCVPQLGDGQACGGAGQCASGNCVDGVCCDQACDGQCQACNVTGSPGTCVAVNGNPQGARPACATDGSACGGSCDGVHGLSCAYPAGQCRGPSCTAGVATLAASCDGAGNCPVQQAQPCAPYVCGANACRGDCVLDSDCAGGNYCAAGVCVPQLVAGAGCGGANQCATGFCVDGVCCDQACNGQCQACDVFGSAGTCLAVAGAPHGARPSCATDGSACGGLCDGSNGAACGYPTGQCRGPSCASGVATLAAACDGAGHCPAPQTQACAPYQCGPAACKGNCSADADCVAGDWCSGGLCVPLLAGGSACSAASQCATGNCVDGVCCDSACGGQCEACNLAGSSGVCIAVIGNPRGGRAACATDGSACGGACDGTNRASCAYPTAACRAPGCANAVVTAAASCDGAGHCPAPQQSSCNAYACGPSACKTSCAADGDCSGGGFCVQGVCHSRNDPSMWVVAGAGGCSETGPAAWPLLLLALAFALRRRKKAIGVLSLALAVSSGARAQSATFTADRFQPGPGAYDVLGVWSADTQDHLQWHASLHSSYARNPLRLVAIGRPDDQVQLLHGQSMLHFAASVGLWDRFEVGAVLPLALAQGSDGAPMLGGPVSNPVASAGLGDLRVLPKARLLRVSGLTLGFGLPFTIPIGRQDAFLGAGGPTVTPTLLAELEDVLPLRLLANLGVAVRGGRSLGNLEVGNALTYGLAAEMPFLVKGQRLAALATLSGEAGLSQGGSVERPLELLAGLRWTAARGLDLSAGGGPGLTDGYGTPSYRLFFSISLTPGALSYRPQPIPQPAILVEAPPRPARVIETVAEPVALSRTLELARIEEDHVELLAPVLFQKDSDILIVQSRAVLDAAVNLLREHPDLVMLRVEGHTDGRGDPRHNLDLSKRRAQAVRRYLVKKGVTSSRLEAEGYGSERPIAANDTAEGRARNRRVEMLILRRSQAVSAASTDE